ncbi:MAG: NADPH:quinone oxidoreductase family protein [Alphaproteobacteria bacterium]|nr:NADPH:quinone oxidoreductase family protein [Alphaproteobacteria bacterium]
MKAAVCHAFGDPETLSVEEVASPVLGPGDVRVAVHAASVNYFDILMVQGRYQRKPALPFVPGTDAAGEVLEVGAAASGIRAGDRVLLFDWIGAFAEEMAVPARNVFPLPDGIEFETAAALKSVYGTALYALRDRARLQAGERLVVHGAAGGVGLAMVEVGRALGAHVVGTVGSDGKAGLVRAAGAEAVINTRTEDLRDRIRSLTDGTGADVICDPVGGALFDQSVRCMAWGGRLLTLGFTSGTIPALPANLALLKSFDLVGVNYGGWVDRDPDAHRAITETTINWCAAGRITPHVSLRFPLDQVREAMQTLLDRRAVGKVVIQVR